MVYFRNKENLNANMRIKMPRLVWIITENNHKILISELSSLLKSSTFKSIKINNIEKYVLRVQNKMSAFTFISSLLVDVSYL